MAAWPCCQITRVHEGVASHLAPGCARPAALARGARGDLAQQMGLGDAIDRRRDTLHPRLELQRKEL